MTHPQHAPRPTLDRDAVLGAIQGLVAKSMVATQVAGATMSYRLLATTRAYAAALGKDDPGQRDAALRHAAYYEEWLKRTESKRQASSDAERLHHLAGLNNVRAALDWCFGANGEIDAGIRLAAAAVPMFLAMSLLTKCHHWCGLALRALPDDRRGGGKELRLQAGLGLSLMFMRGDHAAAQAALERSLAIAEDRGDILYTLALLGPLHMFHVRVGSFRTALDLARRSTIAARTVGDATGIALAHCLLGVSLQAAGRLGDARAELEAALHHERGAAGRCMILPSFDHRNLASIVLARTLWLQGHSSQALEQARDAVDEASRIGHPLTLAIALHWAASVFLWAGNLRRAEEHIDRFVAHAESQSLEPYQALGRGLKGELAIRRGDAGKGVEDLQGCLQELHAARYELLTAALNLPLAEGLAAIGKGDEALRRLDEVIPRVETNGNLVYLPELLRVKGGILLSMPQPDSDTAERCFRQSLALSRRQGARAWELRTELDLAALLISQGRTGSAEDLLQPAD